MDYINSSNAIPIAPPGNGFQGCSPGTDGTYLDMKWLNGVNYELMHFIESIGIAPELFDENVPSTYQQLVRAVRRHISKRGLGVWNADFGSQYVGGNWVLGSDAKFYKLNIGGNGAINPVTVGQTEWAGGFEFAGSGGGEGLNKTTFVGLEVTNDSVTEITVSAGTCRDNDDTFTLELPADIQKTTAPFLPGDGNGSLAAGVSLLTAEFLYSFLVSDGTSVSDIALDDDPTGANILADPLIGGAGLDKIRLIRPIPMTGTGAIFPHLWRGDRCVYVNAITGASLTSISAGFEYDIPASCPPRIHGVIETRAIVNIYLGTNANLASTVRLFYKETAAAFPPGFPEADANLRCGLASVRNQMETEIVPDANGVFQVVINGATAFYSSIIKTLGFNHYRGFAS